MCVCVNSTPPSGQFGYRVSELSNPYAQVLTATGLRSVLSDGKKRKKVLFLNGPLVFRTGVRVKLLFREVRWGGGGGGGGAGRDRKRQTDRQTDRNRERNRGRERQRKPNYLFDTKKLT